MASSLSLGESGGVTGSDATVEFRLNGEVVANGNPGTYVTVEREWQDGDVVEFDVPMVFRTEKYTGRDQHAEYSRYALLYGPILMALVGADDLDVASSTLTKRLTSLDSRPLRFAVEGVPGACYMPYWQMEDDVEFTCFPTMR